MSSGPERREDTPNRLETIGIGGGLTVALGGIIINEAGESPKEQVERLIEENASLREQIHSATTQLKSNQTEIQATKAQNPNLSPPETSHTAAIVGGGGLLCAVVAGLSMAYRDIRIRRWERNAVNSAKQ